MTCRDIKFHNTSILCRDTCELACTNKKNNMKWEIDAKFIFTAPTFKTKSETWDYFGFMVVSDGVISDEKKIACRLCRPAITYSCNTSNMTCHLQGMHSNEYEKYLNTSRKTKNSEISSSETSEQASKDASEPKQITLRVQHSKGQLHFHQTVPGIHLCFMLQLILYFKPCNHWVLWTSQPFIFCFTIPPGTCMEAKACKAGSHNLHKQNNLNAEKTPAQLIICYKLLGLNFSYYIAHS